MKRFCARRDRVEAVAADVRGLAGQPLLDPVLVERDQAEIAPAHRSERVEVAILRTPQPTNSMPSLKLACVWRTKSSSSMPSVLLNRRICGIVASPTPTMPISSDSTRRIVMRSPETLRQRRRRHPACGAAADDDDLADAVVSHVQPPRYALESTVRNFIANKLVIPNIARDHAYKSRSLTTFGDDDAMPTPSR